MSIKEDEDEEEGRRDVSGVRDAQLSPGNKTKPHCAAAVARSPRDGLQSEDLARPLVAARGVARRFLAFIALGWTTGQTGITCRSSRAADVWTRTWVRAAHVASIRPDGRKRGCKYTETH